MLENRLVPGALSQLIILSVSLSLRFSEKAQAQSWLFLGFFLALAIFLGFLQPFALDGAVKGEAALGCVSPCFVLTRVGNSPISIGSNRFSTMVRAAHDVILLIASSYRHVRRGEAEHGGALRRG